MEMTGEQLIPLPQQRVWEALNDPEILKACIPGCESIIKVADDEYAVAMMAAVGPVKARFSGKLKLSDLNPPSSYSLAFEGSGGAAGFGKGSAQVNLATEGSTTRLRYNASASVGGRLAQVGSRLIDGVARKMADDFFARFNATVAPPAAAAPEIAVGPKVVEADDPATPPPGVKYPTVPGWVWIIGAIAVVALLVYVLRGH
jgi:carbon monoxide dehydrogenase subunit G